eukprot:ANDGO_07135.mRNA.1 Endoglycoceramidase
MTMTTVRVRRLSLLIVASVAMCVYMSVCAHARTEGFVQVDSSIGHFKIDDRVAIFHGVNVVYKVFPFVPRTSGPWDVSTSMVEQDFAFLQEMGVTAVRLGCEWPGVEIGDYAYNSTYLSEMEYLVNQLGKYGIYTILDAHQDLLSRKTCGEGAYEGVVAPAAGSAGYPVPVTKDPFPVNQTTGLIDLDQCLSINFFSGYWSYAVSSMFQDFYDNVHGGKDHFAGFWEQVALRFAGNPYVIMYELLNEPWPGDVHKYPELELISGLGDRKNLVPLYEAAYQRIRKHDESHAIAYECAVHGSDFGAGFESFPGGSKATNTTVYSYHVYCSDSDSHLDPKSLALCMVEWDHAFYTRLDDAKRISNVGASFLTEFGANDNKTIGVDGDHYVLNLADDHLQSWTYWQYKYFHDLTTSGDSSESLFNPDGSMQLDKVKALSRSHAQRIAGVPKQNRFYPDSGSFRLSYVADCRSASKLTEVYFSENLWYPNGYTTSVYPPSNVQVTYAGKNKISIVHSASLCGQEIYFQLDPK